MCLSGTNFNIMKDREWWCPQDELPPCEHTCQSLPGRVLLDLLSGVQQLSAQAYYKLESSSRPLFREGLLSADTFEPPVGRPVTQCFLGLLRERDSPLKAFCARLLSLMM
jgi:hypothetical protein